MIRSITYLFCCLLLVPALARAQSVIRMTQPPSQETNITMDDLHYEKSIEYQPGSVFSPFRNKSGLALVSSAVLPGAGQAINGKWLRAGSYLLAEAVTLTIHFISLNKARKEQRRYEEFALDNWSVVNYAQWLVDYHEQNGIPNPHIDRLRNQIEGKVPSFDRSDWQKVDIEILREVERSTPFVYPDRTGNNFSHVMPDFGSQQYYELISKYYQFGPGWNDFGINREGNQLDNQYQLNWNGTDMPFNFLQGANLAESFNDKYRRAGNMVSLLLLNHIVSAFDAFITVKKRKIQVKANSHVLDYRSITLKYNF